MVQHVAAPVVSYAAAPAVTYAALKPVEVKPVEVKAAPVPVHYTVPAATAPVVSVYCSVPQPAPVPVPPHNGGWQGDAPVVGARGAFTGLRPVAPAVVAAPAAAPAAAEAEAEAPTVEMA